MNTILESQMRYYAAMADCDKWGQLCRRLLKDLDEVNALADGNGGGWTGRDAVNAMLCRKDGGQALSDLKALAGGAEYSDEAYEAYARYADELERRLQEIKGGWDNGKEQ